MYGLYTCESVVIYGRSLVLRPLSQNWALYKSDLAEIDFELRVKHCSLLLSQPLRVVAMENTVYL